MSENRLCAEDDFARICIEGIATVDTTKLSYFLADDWSPRTAYFFEITNKREHDWEFTPDEFEIVLPDGTTAGFEHFIFYHELELPTGWQLPSEPIPANRTAKLFLIPDADVGAERPDSITYEQMLAEAWYQSIKSTPELGIADFTGDNIHVPLSVSPEQWEKLKTNRQ